MTLVAELASRIALPYSTQSKAQVADRIARGIRFEVFIQSLVTALGPQVIETLDILGTGQPNYNHDFISLTAAHKLCPLVLTTNFDPLLEKSLSMHACDFNLFYLASHYRHYNPRDDCFKLFKLHGSLYDQKSNKAHSSIVISAKQVGRPVAKAKARVLRQILKNYDIIFWGYSGLDDFDLLPILLTTESERSVYWIEHNTNIPGLEFLSSKELRTARTATRPSNPERVVASRKDGFLVRGLTFDFIAALSEHLFHKPLLPLPQVFNKPDFGYLDDWEKNADLPSHIVFLNGLMLQKLEDHQSALDFFSHIPRRSPHYENAKYLEAVSLRHCNHTDTARKQLKKLLSKDFAPSIRLKASVQLGLLESERRNFRSARHYLYKVVQTRHNDLSIILAARVNLGLYHLLEAERLKFRAKPPARFTKALHAALHHLRLAEETIGKDGDPHTLANINGNLGLVYTFQKKFSAAERKLFEALRLFRCLNIATEEASCLDNIGFYYKERAIYSKANPLNYIKYLRQALAYSLKAYRLKKRVSTPRRIAISEHGLGEISYLLGRHQEALRWLEGSLRIFKEQGLASYCEDVARTLEKIKQGAQL